MANKAAGVIVLISLTSVFVCGKLMTQHIFNPAKDTLPDFLQIEVKGTGKTTGEIAFAEITNRSEESIRLVIQPGLIPSGGIFQSYVLPDTTFVDLSPNNRKTIRLRGYCSNPFQEPVPFGDKMPDIEYWEFPTATFIKNGLPSYPFWERYIADHFFPGFQAETDDFCLIFTRKVNCIPVNFYPESLNLFVETHPVDHPDRISDCFPSPIISQTEHTEIAAYLLLDAIQKLEALIFQNETWQDENIGHEFRIVDYKAIVAQHALWVYAAGLIKRDYSREDFRDFFYAGISRVMGYEEMVSTLGIRQLDSMTQIYWDAVSNSLRETQLCYPNKTSSSIEHE